MFPGIISPKTAGAFYVSVVFKNGVLNLPAGQADNKQKLEIKTPRSENLLKKKRATAWRRTKDSFIT